MPRTSGKTTRRSRSKGYDIDFTDVETGGISVDDGTYPATVAGCTLEESEHSGQDYLAWKFKLDDSGATVFDNTSLQPQALWRLKGLLTVLGVDVPDGVMSFNPEDVVDLPLQLEVTNEEWEGQRRPRVTAYLPERDIDEEEKKPVKRGRGRPKKKVEESPEKPAPRRRGRKPKGPRVGDAVRFEDDGDEFNGEITAVDGDTLTVTTEDGDEWELDKSEILTD